MEVRVVNWRCIEDLEIETSRLNVFVGKNSTGKSSLAYALYFTSKTSEGKPMAPEWVLAQLYGYGFDKVARIVNGKPQFPVSIKAGEHELIVRPVPGEGRFEVIRPKTSPWTDEFLLPSRRIDFMHILMFLPKLVRASVRGTAASLRELTGPSVAAVSMFTWLFELVKELPILPPFGHFATDLTRALGVPIEPLSREIPELGSYTVVIPYLIRLMDIRIRDPFTKLELPLELSPDGVVDFAIFDAMTERAPEGSLIVIEEPEIHKNPLMILDFIKQVAERALDRDLTVVMTTHSDLVPSALAKLVGDGLLEVDDLRIYYFRRSKKRPWTQVSEIPIFEDGTTGGFPDAEEVISRLF